MLFTAGVGRRDEWDTATSYHAFLASNSHTFFSNIHLFIIPPVDITRRKYCILFYFALSSRDVPDHFFHIIYSTRRVFLSLPAPTGVQTHLSRLSIMYFNNKKGFIFIEYTDTCYFHSEVLHRVVQ